MIIKAKYFNKLLHKKGTVFKLANDITYVTMDTTFTKVKNLECGNVMTLPHHFLSLNAEDIDIIDHARKEIYVIKNVKSNIYIGQYQRISDTIEGFYYDLGYPTINACINDIITYYGDMPFSIANLEILKVDSISNDILETNSVICKDLHNILSTKMAPTARYIKEQYSRNMDNHIMVHVQVKQKEKFNVKDFDNVEKIHTNSKGTFIRISYTDDIDSIYDILMYVALKLDICFSKSIDLYACKDKTITKLQH